MKNTVTLLANKNNLNSLYQFIQNVLTKQGVSLSQINIFEMVCEEIFINISNYAYETNEKSNSKNEIEIEIEVLNDEIVITFKDEGLPFNPLSIGDPDLSKKSEDRDYGGLGLLMVKKSVDKMEYAFEEHKNILKLFKTLADNNQRSQ